MKRAVGVVMALAFAAGCASMSVSIEHSRGVDFTEFETFQYQDSDTRVADTNPAAHRRTVNAIKRELTADGLTEAASDPDLFVTYYGESTEDTVADPSAFGYAADSRFYLVGGSTATMTIEHGTIVVDLWDTSTNELVWRGEVMKMLSRNPDANLNKIDEGIARMFRGFPPAS